ncbi:MAG: 16S rRNA processing protein RimM [Chitinophagales bacterium]|nr:16S rRNA processing protein RimM [Chitinophagales bacterium]
MDDYSKIGRITKAHGITGELKIKFLYSLLNPENIPNHIFISDGKETLPYFIENIRRTKHPEYILKLEGCDTKSKADELSSFELFIELGKESEYFHTNDKKDLTGFMVYSSEGESIGQIEEVMDMPAHPTFSIQYNGKYIMLPQVEDLIINIDYEKRKIIYKLPSGILDI